MKLNPDKVQQGLGAKRFGREILFFHKIASTNDFGREVASFGAPEGTIVLAETQTAGRGRSGNKWFSPLGGLWFSLILRPKLHVPDATGLTFMAGLAVAEVLEQTYNLKVKTKWPNDVLLNGKKVCGILTESSLAEDRVNFVVVGIGLNANFVPEQALPEKMSKMATSLEAELERKIELEELLRKLLERMETVYDTYLAKGSVHIVGEWKKFAAFLGSEIRVISENEEVKGLALNVDNQGALILKLQDGAIRRIFGDFTVKTDKT